MTDKQIVDILLKRADKAAKQINGKGLSNAQIVLVQQYKKKLYFGIMHDTVHNPYPLPIAFSYKGKTMVFMLPELPDHLIDWKRSVITAAASTSGSYVPFDIDASPKEIVHIFSSAIISALNTDGMGIHIMGMGLPTLFMPNETYEEVSIETDLMEFSS